MDISDLQQRLNDYMYEGKYSSEDVAKTLNVSLRSVESFFNATSGTHVLFNKVINLVSNPALGFPAPVSKTFKDRATDALKAFKAQDKLSWKDVALLLNCADIRVFKPGALSVAISPSGSYSNQFFMDVLESIKWCETSDTVSDTAQDAVEPPKVEQEAVDVPTVEYEDEASDIIKEGVIKDEAKAMLEHMLGVELWEVKAMKPAIEHIAVCIRNGTPCRIVVDDVRVGVAE